MIIQMALSVPGFVRRLLTEYVFEVAPQSLNEDLTCILCKKLMIDAYQASCGCQYCLTCITDYLANGNIYCGGLNEGCTDEPLIVDTNVLRNARMNRSIQRLKLVCPNESCSDITELAQMEDHLRVCTKHPIMCPFAKIGCTDTDVEKEVITVHMQEEMMRHMQLLLENNDQTKNEINDLRKDLQMCKSEESKQLEKIVALKEDAKDKETIMKNMMTRMTRLELENHSRREESLDIKNTVDALTEQLKNDSASLQLSLKMEIEESLKCLNESMNGLQSKVQKLESYLKIANNKIAPTVQDSGITLQIDEFFFQKEKWATIFSQFFYSHKNGYKLRLRVDPGGINGGAGSHLSISFAIHKGEYDNTLPWPCRRSITISIINQCTDMPHKSETFNYSNVDNEHINAFDKPLIKENQGCGRDRFISHNELYDVVGLVVNESVVIQCSIVDPL